MGEHGQKWGAQTPLPTNDIGPQAVRMLAHVLRELAGMVERDLAARDLDWDTLRFTHVTADVPLMLPMLRLSVCEKDPTGEGIAR